VNTTNIQTTDAPPGSAFRLPSAAGRCPGCGGPLDATIDGGDERGLTVMLTCLYECDDPGLQSDWQPIIDAARRYVNTPNPKRSDPAQ
jgi:hypothetical protein